MGHFGYCVPCGARTTFTHAHIFTHAPQINFCFFFFGLKSQSFVPTKIKWYVHALDL